MRIRASVASVFAVGTALAFAAAGAVAQQGAGSNSKASVWSGVYTQAQSKRGEELYSGACEQCHGARLNGAGQPDQPPSPAIARATFLRKWNGKTVAELFTYVRETMPTDRPGTLTPQQAIDSIAHMFAVSDMPAGDKELEPEGSALANIVIEDRPKPK